MTAPKLRAAAAVASVAVIALAGCGGGGTVERLTPSPSAESSADPAGSSPDAAHGDSELTMVRATDDDLEPAKDALREFYELIYSGRADEACKRIYSDELGGLPTGQHFDDCVRQLTETGRDAPAGGADGVADVIEARLTQDGMIELENPAEQAVLYFAKGSDGTFYYYIDKSSFF